MAAPRRAVVVIGLGVLTALVFGAVAFLFLQATEEEPEDGPVSTPSTTEGSVIEPGDPRPVAQAFLVAWGREDWTALNALATDLSAGSNHAEWWRSLDANNVDLTLGPVEMLSEGRAFARFDVSLDVGTAGNWTYASQLTLIWDGASWLVDWFPDVLHPLLTGGDRLDLVRTWPERAPIRGSDGSILATTLPTVLAGVIPNRVTSRVEVGEAFDTYTEASAADVDDALDAPNVQPDWFLPIVEIAREDYPDVRPALYPVPGIAFRVTEGRAPVEPGLALHVLGTTGEISAELLAELGEPYRVGDVVGRTPSSLERTHERTLAGSPTIDVVKVGAGGDTEILHTFPGTPAETLDTTLSLRVQRAAEAALEGVPTPAALVAIDIPSGGIRAIVSRPLEQFNRAATGLYPPGSTFKLVITLAALESGFTRDSSVSCPAEVEVGGQVFGNAVRLPGSMTIEQALVRSCNTAFIQLAGTLDPDAIQSAAGRLGFNLDYTIGIGTPGGAYPTPTSQTEAAAAAIGQARVLATPVHMASVAAGIARSGWIPPTLLDRPLVDPVDPIDPDIAATIRDLMINVVENRNGTGRNAAVDGLTVGGKTGTAQFGSEEDDPLVTWFVGFSDDLAFAVMVEQGESGGGTAAPIAAAFLEFLQQIPESGGSVQCTDASNGWPTFQGNGQRTGCATGVEAVTTPEVKWSAEIGAQAWLNNPVVADGLVIVGSAGASRGRPDSQDGIVAVRLDDGTIEWRVGAAGDVNGVAVGNGVVVATGDDGSVRGIRASDGRLLWEFDAGTLVFTNPLIVDDRVIV
ncbi:MAG: PQQ-binding-like beta-propeller repeat protein, partial [Actinobacteria bacterium]|nr:PQQ-binding-like beta-propeller repeat protein [Actinomycetota bacterium]